VSDIAIRADDLGKLYLLGHPRGATHLREIVMATIRAPFQQFTSGDGRRSAPVGRPLSHRFVWALRHLSIEIKRGEVVAILGGNGGGKTTLLSILSQITHPTEGCVEIHGRVGTLLDVGAGFHGELTGLENIYLSGSVRGMTSVENKRKLEEIVAFAELEKFVDTPLKHYSSGMCMRLAFAVAVYLDSEILLVDEVLGLADQVFQKKCMEKIAAAVRQGRTVLLVSHDMDYIRQLCGRGIVVAGGNLVYIGSAPDAVSLYCSASGLQNRNKPTVVQDVLKEN
jgi:lipopolysaccharide transport system ATP-binding protein